MNSGSQTVEIIPHRLYWNCDSQPIANPKIHSFTVDNVSFI